MRKTQQMVDQPKRSIVKAITYRGVIMCSDGVIIYLITHRYDIALSVIFFSNLASTILYVVHERIWTNIHWGKTVQGKLTSR